MFGPVFKWKLGTETVVAVLEYDTVKSLLQHGEGKVGLVYICMSGMLYFFVLASIRHIVCCNVTIQGYHKSATNAVF